ncbi:MAG: 2-oxoglutarate dehydrogenase complex dihydrolipoyllysine-residue succinyltransferase [Alphaproteobacteria bacterium]|nr:2-oxoglutarate dehydrogenase complex dihydrolipoyllysine-residue succinyltransferase [Alphaproteobacteria bacterium]
MALPVTIPKIGESVATVFINKWLKKPGDHVEVGENLLEIDSDKASMEVPSPASGTVTELLAAEGDEVEVGAVVAQLDENGVAAAAPAEAPAAADEAPALTEAPAAKGDVKAGPAARAEASEQGVDLSGVKGSGKGGRVTRADVSKAVAQGGQRAEPPPAAKAPAVDDTERVTRVKMSPLRRTVARRLVQAQQEAAMLTTFNEVDMSAIMAVRKRYQDRFVARHGIKLGFMSFFVKGVIEGLKAFPAVNAEIDGNDVLYKRYYNLGVAVSGPKGLVVPVLRDADRLSFAETEQGIAELATRARDNKLRLEDFDDGTFTISNGGVFGSMMSTPILNPPQVGILGMHNIVERAVVRDGQIVIAPMMYLALSYDHRIIDGREAVSFLVRVKECVEDPERLLLEV